MGTSVELAGQCSTLKPRAGVRGHDVASLMLNSITTLTHLDLLIGRVIAAGSDIPGFWKEFELMQLAWKCSVWL